MLATKNIKQFMYEGFDEIHSRLVLNDVQDEQNPQPEIVVEQAPPPAPTFSAEELEAAKSLALAEGMEKGYEQAKRQFEEDALAKETKLSAAITAIATKINQINAQVAEQKSLLTHDFASLALSLAKQICKNIPEADVLAHLKASIFEELSKVEKEQGIKIILNPQNAAELNDKFTGASVIGSEEVALGDFKIEWQNGYLEQDTQKIWLGLEQTVSKYFAKSQTTEIIENENNEVQQGE